MATYSLRALINGINSPINDADSGRINSIRIGTSTTNTELTKAILDKLVLIHNAADADGTFDTRYATLAHDHAATEISYAPSTGANWPVSPADVGEGLDTLASETSSNNSVISNHTANTSNPHMVTKSQVLSGDLIVNSDIDSVAAISFSKMESLTADRAIIADSSGDLAVSPITSAEIGHLDGVTSNIQGQLNTLESGFGRRPAVINYITDNTAAPPTEVDGDRYILSHDGGAPHAGWDGALAGDLVEFDGTSSLWVSTTPTEGWITYDDTSNQDYLYVDDGTGQWENRAVQSTSLADSKIWIGNASGEATPQTITGDISISNAGLVSISSEVIVDGDINAAAAIATSKLADNTELSEAVTFFGSTDISASEAEQLTDGSNTDTLHKHEKLYKSFTNNTGSAYSAGDIVILGTIAGEIADADASAISTCEFVAGVVAESIANGAGGLVQISGEATVNNGAVNFDISKRVYVSETAKQATKTAPSASNSVIYLLGGATDVDKVLLQPSLEAIN